MALVVVVNHLHPFDDFLAKNIFLKNAYDFIIQFAVPFFFITTGFFIGKKISNIDKLSDDDYNILISHLKKTLKIYILYTLIYFPLSLYGFVYENKNIIEALVYFIRGILFVGENFNSWILWYILSEIYFYVFIINIKKITNNVKKICIIGLWLYIIGIIINVFNNSVFNHEILMVLQKIVKIFIPNGRIFYSFIFIPIGIIISKKEKLKKIPIYFTLLTVIIISNIYIYNEIYSKISLLICSTILFKFIINTNAKNEKISNFCKKYSQNLYFWHLLVWSILSYIYDGYIHCNYGFSYYIITIGIIFIATIINTCYYKIKLSK